MYNFYTGEGRREGMVEVKTVSSIHDFMQGEVNRYHIKWANPEIRV